MRVLVFLEKGLAYDNETATPCIHEYFTETSALLEVSLFFADMSEDIVCTYFIRVSDAKVRKSRRRISTGMAMN